MEEDDLFTNDKDICWKIPEPTEEMRKLMDLYPVAPCTEEEYNEWCEPWNYALILTVLGRKFNLFVLKDLLTNLWGFSSFELIDIPNNYFVVRFQDQELWKTHYKKVLYEGPWVIKQHCVIVQRWTPYFNPYENALGRVATWVRIPDVPMHLYNKHCISRLGDRIGRTLKVDMNTLQDCQNASPKIQRGKFVRICVELNLQKKLVPKVIVAGSIFNVEYEGLTLICFECGRFGHKREKCPHQSSDSDLQNVHHNPPPPPPMSVNTSAKDSDEAFGPWMLVNRRNRRSRPVHWSDSKQQQQASGSGARPVLPTAIVQKSRYAPIEDSQNLEVRAATHTAEQEAVPRVEQATFRKDSNISGSARMTASKQQGQWIESGTKLKAQYKAKDKKSDASTSGPKSDESEPSNVSLPMDLVGPGQQVHTTSNESPSLNNAPLNETCTSTDANGHVGLLDSLNQADSIMKPSGGSNANKALVLHMGPKKAIGKKNKYKGPRTHVVVQGNLNYMSQQA
ncbi:hypothetical protein QN277_011605 [Acacia crassicarpa]|nr:hypothetical protein QN277_011605 [Acacia crassicarpa]